MTTLYLDRRDLELRIEGQSLAVFAADARQTSVPLHLVERVVLRSSVRLQSAALARLADSGIGVLSFGGWNGSKQAVIHGRSHNDAARRIGQYRLYEDPDWRRAWSARLVRGKLQWQRRILQRGLLERPDRRQPLIKVLETVKHAGDRVRRDPSLSVEALRGIEGAAAASYFRGLAELLPPALDFNGRNRRPPKDPFNAVLSFGYTLLHFEAVRACQVAGLDPMIGYYHELAFGRESLASDLIEPLRPRLDTWAWEQFRGRTLREEHFTREGGACLLGKTGRQRFFREYEGFARPLRRLLRRFAQRLAKHATAAAPTLSSPEEQDE